MEVKTITKENFESEVLASEKPVLLDFWASWCGPCKMQSPIIDEIASEHDEIVVGKVNVDDEGSLAAMFGVLSIPTLVVVKNGEVSQTTVGYTPKQELLEMLGL